MILGQTFSLLANNCISRLQTFMCMNWVTSLVIHFVGLKRTMLFYSIQRNRLVNKQKKKKKKRAEYDTIVVLLCFVWKTIWILYFRYLLWYLSLSK